MKHAADDNTYTQDMIPYWSASEVNVKVGVTVFDAHQTVPLDLGPVQRR